MILPSHLPLADTLSRTYYEFAKLHAMTEWWHWLLLGVTCTFLLAYVGFVYLVDSVELPTGLAWSLAILRVSALLAILFTFLDLEKRTERKIVRQSRNLLLFDTSQSMGLADADSTSVPAAPSRIEQIVAHLEGSDLIQRLRAKHDVIAYRFDQTSIPTEIASFSKLMPPVDPLQAQVLSTESRLESLAEARRLAILAATLAALSLAMAVIYLGTVAKAPLFSWLSLTGVLSLVAAVVTLAVMNLRNPDIAVGQLLGFSSPMVADRVATAEPSDDHPEKSDPVVEDSVAEEVVDWHQQLLPRGHETRLGESLRFLIDKERGGPVAGIVLFSDGNNNAGLKPSVAVKLAKAAGIRVYTVGLGSDRRPVNVRVADLRAPQRVYPGDAFTLSGFIQSYGLAGRSVKVELYSVPIQNEGDQPGAAEFEEERRIQLDADDKLLPVRFEVTPREQGRRLYRLRVTPPRQDMDARDNEATTMVQIVERKSRVLLVAGGPTREYRFLRNMLYRDHQTLVDVLLQTAQPGISQEADDILFEFPGTVDKIFEYDAIVAFDPDWTALDRDQIELLDRWVAEQAGGLIVVAGPVHTPLWSGTRRGDSRIDTIKSLYPVVFYSQGSATLHMGRFGSQIAWPLQFTTEGAQSEFLWLDETASSSEKAWAGFEGVYGYYAVKNAKPGATVYAHFSDPQATIDSQLPIFMAGHFYGAGRVWYLASGEMWRLRATDESHFDEFYTKLIRHVSQGRLLRDSSHGLLMVGKQRCLLGDTVAVRAALTDPQHRPLEDDQVTAMLVLPDSTRQQLVLRKVTESARQGMYAAHFTTLLEGNYRLELPIPHADVDDLLVSEVRVRVPDLEVENPQRNDALLKDIAKSTGGTYYVGMEAAVTSQGPPPLDQKIVPQDQQTYLPGKPDRRFQQQLMFWLLVLISGTLCTEWLLRRLNRLA